MIVAQNVAEAAGLLIYPDMEQGEGIPTENHLRHPMPSLRYFDTTSPLR